jgi:hypothetical protein
VRQIQPGRAAGVVVFAQTRRVLRPGGAVAGRDSLPNAGFRLIQIFGTMVSVHPQTLPHCRTTAGFTRVRNKGHSAASPSPRAA